jgi:uncharacterized protein (DUF342 family)
MTSPGTQNDQETPEYVAPVLCFSTLRIKIGEDFSADEISVSELVKKDQPLLEFPNPDQYTENTVLKQPIEVGTNCFTSDDNTIVYSQVTGYPKIKFLPFEDKTTRLLHISVEPLFRITADRMKASIALHPQLPASEALTEDMLDQLLSAESIVFGLNSENISYAKECIRAGRKEFNVINVATGKAAIHGTNAYLKFEVETGPIPGRILKDGSIDFRERKIFVPVSAGQLIARKIAATLGTPGKTIKGERIEPIPGRDIAVNTLKDATYSSKTKKVIATSDGMLSVVGDTIIKVCSRQEIMGDIDYTTGHIESRNCVLIHGSVQPGFLVKTDGDLEIRGAVMSTRISCQANLSVKGGITGKNSTLYALGDADIYFIEQGKITSGRNCIIRQQSYYSKIISGGDIRCTQKSAVVGGEVIAAGSVTLGNIGSPNASPAFIAAGVDGNRLIQFNELRKSLIEQQEGLIQWIQMHKGTPHAAKIRKMEKQIKETKIKLLRMNMIPCTGLYSRAGQGSESNRKNSPESSDKDSIAIQDIAIEICGIVYAGTILQIGNKTMKLEYTIANRLFKLNDTLTEIAAFPLRRR